MLLVGIDPGKNSGYAIWCKQQRQLLSVGSTDFWGLVALLKSLDLRKIKAVHIENPNFNRPTFSKGVDSAKQREKISQNVGENKAHATLLIQFCERHQIPVVPVKPTKYTMSKKSAEEFERLTGWKGQTNSHGRDAAMLIYGM